MIAPAVVIGTSFASRLRDELLVHVDFEPLDAAFAALSAILDTPDQTCYDATVTTAYPHPERVRERPYDPAATPEASGRC